VRRMKLPAKSRLATEAPPAETAAAEPSSWAAPGDVPGGHAGTPYAPPVRPGHVR